jgi:hypothetical protein
MFDGCTALTSVSLGNHLTTICNQCFQGAIALTSITLPSTVTDIQTKAFKDCTSLTSIIFNGLVSPSVGNVDWILNVPVGARGHAFSNSNFPVPGNAFNGLMMGIYIQPSIISGEPTVSVNEDSAYSYAGTADQSGIWSIVSTFTFLSVSAGGLVTGIPDNSQVAAHSVSLQLTNANGTAFKNWSLTVTNTAVLLTSSPVLAGNQYEIYSYNAQSTDEGVGAIYSMTCTSPDLSISSSTGLISGKVRGASDIEIHLTVDDGHGGIDRQNWTVDIVPGHNSPPSDWETDPQSRSHWVLAIIVIGGVISIVAVGFVLLKGDRRMQ